MALSFQINQEVLINKEVVNIVKISGAIDISTSNSFEKELHKIYDQKVKYVVLVFSEVTHINSSGMGILVKVTDLFQEKGGNVNLVDIPEKLLELFDMLGLLSLFKIHPTEQKALEAISLQLPIIMVGSPLKHSPLPPQYIPLQSPLALNVNRPQSTIASESPSVYDNVYGGGIFPEAPQKKIKAKVVIKEINKTRGIQILPDYPDTVAISDNVNFSVSTPDEVSANSSFIADLWVYLESQKKLMREQAKNNQQTEKIYLRSTTGQIERGTILHVLLDLPNFKIDDYEDTVVWQGNLTNANFMVHVPQVKPGEYPGKIKIYTHSLEIARLYFFVKVGCKQPNKNKVNTSTKCFVHRTAFASYATKNRNEVLARIQGIQKVLPHLDIFVDIASLRSGQKWRECLNHEIKSRDVFYLFWSQAASRSYWVKREWQIALKAKGIDYIDPIPLDSPEKVPPPKQLAQLHFNDWTIAYIKDSNPIPEEFVKISQEQSLRLKEMVSFKTKNKKQAMHVWSLFKKYFKLTKYSLLPASRYQEALNWLRKYEK